MTLRSAFATLRLRFLTKSMNNEQVKAHDEEPKEGGCACGTEGCGCGTEGKSCGCGHDH